MPGFIKTEESGDPGEVRTRDNLIKSQVLYQLSYRITIKKRLFTCEDGLCINIARRAVKEGAAVFAENSGIFTGSAYIAENAVFQPQADIKGQGGGKGFFTRNIRFGGDGITEGRALRKRVQ